MVIEVVSRVAFIEKGLFDVILKEVRTWLYLREKKGIGQKR